uniref:Uncharacterized protein n=1 Tax=Glossina austeni TaxID=7395 RepID=A0A1A9VA44_GLOAU
MCTSSVTIRPTVSGAIILMMLAAQLLIKSKSPNYSHNELLVKLKMELSANLPRGKNLRSSVRKFWDLKHPPLYTAKTSVYHFVYDSLSLSHHHSLAKQEIQHHLLNVTGSYSEKIMIRDFENNSENTFFGFIECLSIEYFSFQLIELTQCTSTFLMTKFRPFKEKLAVKNVKTRPNRTLYQHSIPRQFSQFRISADVLVLI